MGSGLFKRVLPNCGVSVYVIIDPGCYKRKMSLIDVVFMDALLVCRATGKMIRAQRKRRVQHSHPVKKKSIWIRFEINSPRSFVSYLLSVKIESRIKEN